MITSIKSARIITPDGLQNGYVNIERDKIISITAAPISADKEYDVGNAYLSPGFIDIHTHGGAGHDFSGTPEDVSKAADFHLTHGTTSICPTVSAAPIQIMSDALKSISAAKKQGMSKANIIGAHLEGPYLSAAQCGAQSPDFITCPKPEDYIPLVDMYGDDIARWTYAPENDTNGSFCRFLISKGIIPSAGHTNATGEEMTAAVKNGCNLITHLYSCTSTITRDHGFRRLGVIETAFLYDDIYVEIIADGNHLPADLVRLILKVKGMDKVALVTDSLHLAGTDIKQGRMMATEFIIEDGVCKLLDRSAFAGSIATTDRLVRFLVQEVGVSIADAVKMITAVPAQILNLNKGNIAPGQDADLISFDDEINVNHAWVMGQQKF